MTRRRKLSGSAGNCLLFYLGMQILPPGQDSDEDCKYDRCSLFFFFFEIKDRCSLDPGLFIPDALGALLVERLLTYSDLLTVDGGIVCLGPSWDGHGTPEAPPPIPWKPQVGYPGPSGLIL